MRWKIHNGDALKTLRRMKPCQVQMCVTSPPYWGLRDYGVDGQLGLEETPDAYVERLVEVFREVRRVLRDDGTLWLNLGDSYAATGKSGGGEQGERWERSGHITEGPRGGRWSPAPAGLKPKDLVGIPWRVAFALQADGWWLRSDIIWSKPNPMPESVRDRPTKAHEYVFLLSKSERYFYDADAIAEPLATDPSENYPARACIIGRGTQGAADARGNDRDKSGGFPPSTNGDGPTRNARTVWEITTKPFPEAHFAVFPPELAEKCILAGSAEDDIVLDPFSGAGTTGVVCAKTGRSYAGIELNADYVEMSQQRITEAVQQYQPLLKAREVADTDPVGEDFPCAKYLEGLTRRDVVEALIDGSIDDLPGIGKVRAGYVREGVLSWIQEDFDVLSEST